MKKRLFTLAATAACGLLMLSGCAYGPPSNVMQFVASLDAAHEVPPRASNGTGHADVEYNRDTGELRWTVMYGGLTGPATVSHIHGPAAVGANAAPVVPFKTTPSPITGTAKITPAQAGDLLAGLWYVNVHTAANPGGEIRGQLTQKR